MLQEVFQQAEVGNDSIQSIFQKSADTLKYYKSLMKITFTEMEKGFTILFLKTYIGPMIKLLERYPHCFEDRGNEIMNSTPKERFLEIFHDF